MPVQRMQTYNEFEAEQRAALEALRKRNFESITCTNCGSQFFEQVNVCKFKADHNLILGQDVPSKSGAQPYKLLKCIHCKQLLEPRVVHNSRDLLSGDYYELLETLEGKRDTRPKVKPEAKKNGTIQSEEL